MQEAKPRSFVKWKTFVFQNKTSNGNPDSAPTEPPDRSGLHCHNAFNHPGNVRPAHLLVVSKGSDRKSTRLNSSHGYISYAVFCLKKKKKKYKKKHQNKKRK